MNETCPCINRNAGPNNNQLITYFQRFSYLLRILQYPVNNICNRWVNPNWKPWVDGLVGGEKNVLTERLCAVQQHFKVKA